LIRLTEKGKEGIESRGTKNRKSKGGFQPRKCNGRKEGMKGEGKKRKGMTQHHSLPIQRKYGSSEGNVPGTLHSHLSTEARVNDPHVFGGKNKGGQEKGKPARKVHKCCKGETERENIPRGGKIPGKFNKEHVMISTERTR